LLQVCIAVAAFRERKKTAVYAVLFLIVGTFTSIMAAIAEVPEPPPRTDWTELHNFVSFLAIPLTALNTMLTMELYHHPRHFGSRAQGVRALSALTSFSHLVVFIIAYAICNEDPIYFFKSYVWLGQSAALWLMLSASVSYIGCVQQGPLTRNINLLHLGHLNNR